MSSDYDDKVVIKIYKEHKKERKTNSYFDLYLFCLSLLTLLFPSYVMAAR